MLRAMNTQATATTGAAGMLASLSTLFALLSNALYLEQLSVALRARNYFDPTVLQLAAAICGAIGSAIALYFGRPRTVPDDPKAPPAQVPEKEN
jgi:sulfite exporter TauE/SafE